MKKIFLIIIVSMIGSVVVSTSIILLGRYKLPNNPKSLTQVADKQNSVKTPTDLPNEISAVTQKPEHKEPYMSAYVTNVIDGDTIEVQTGERIRYIGINTPEIKHRDKRIRCLAQEAKKINESLVLHKTVQLKKDVSEIDKFGRLLRYVYIDNLFVNEYLVRKGYAYASSFPPDVMYESLFHEAQKDAQENQEGLWSKDLCR